MSNWAPDQNAVNQLVNILMGTLSAERSVREQATSALKQAEEREQELDNYLLHVLIEGKQVQPQVRAASGLVLKNDVARNWMQKSPQVKQYLLERIPLGLMDNAGLVRNITGNVITTLLQIVGVTRWPNILGDLMQLATNQNGSTDSQEGAMSSLAKICEDSASTLDKEYANGDRPLNFMVPQFIELTTSQSARVRVLALTCLNYVLEIESQSILVLLDKFLSRLFELATDKDPKVRTSVCRAFNEVVEMAPSKLAPHLAGIIDYCVHTMGDDDDDVALQACEVLLSISSSTYLANHVESKLDVIIPALLKNMVYSEMEVFLMEGQDENDDENVVDKDEDIKPTAVKSRGNRTRGNNTDTASDSELSDDSSDLSDADDSDLTPSWTIRKCAAATLDSLASGYPQKVFLLTLPAVKQQITSEKWPIREAAILALGAVAEGCWQVAANELPSLVPYLVERLSDPQPRVRLIACWTLGRYSSWICEQAAQQTGCANYFRPTFTCIMDCALDRKKVVQQSACSALADFIDSSTPDILAQFIEPLLQHFNMYFQKYQRKNMIILYDTVQTFSEKVGYLLKGHDNLIKMLLPPLMTKWQVLKDDDHDLWPLLECLSSVAAALEESFAPYASPVYDRAVRVLSNCLQGKSISLKDADYDAPENDFIVTALDLIDGLVQGLGAHFNDLVQSSGQPEGKPNTLMQSVIQSMQGDFGDIRQSAYALLGDLCIYGVHNFILPFLHDVMVCIGNEIANHTYDSIPSCNNAIWALGELSLRIDSNAMSPYLDNFLRILAQMCLETDMDSTILENTAITIGRLGNNNASSMGQYLSQVLFSWSSYMLHSEENQEKRTAFQGMCNIIMANPSMLNTNDAATEDALCYFLACIATYEDPGEELGQTFHLLVHGIQNGLGTDQWSKLISKLDDGHKASLIERYGS